MTDCGTDFHEILAGLRRPSLLIRAARFGLGDYRRERDLRRLIDREMPPCLALERLLEMEAAIEASRVRGDAAYSAVRHIDVMIAMMGEARMLPHPARNAA